MGETVAQGALHTQPHSGRAMKVVDRTGQCISKRFQIKKMLGHGGMGTVYLAYDERKHRDVALKILHDELRDKEWIVVRFAREVDFLRTLSHPNVVDLIDAGYEGRMLYFTMEYIHGCNLREWMYRQGTMDFASVVHILCLVAKGLNYVHSRYIHRDIAPENIMVCKDGTVKIIDFGLARKNICDEGLTLIGTSLGRTEYNSPEQERNAAMADYRTDLYPLGKMLYEMMTGDLPMRDATLESLAADLPPGCLPFLQKTLAADPDQRYPSGKAAGADLLAIYNRGRAASASAPMLRTPVDATKKRSRWAALWANVRAMFGRKP